MIFDLGETHLQTIEDKRRSYFETALHGGGEDYSEPGLAYNVVIVGESMGTVRELCQGSARISRCGYLHPVSHAAVSPIEPVMANTYCVER